MIFGGAPEYLPPKTWRYFCTEVRFWWYLECRLVGVLVDENGNILGSYEAEQIARSPMRCVKILTPEKEGFYVFKFDLYEPSGRFLFTWEVFPFVVSTEYTPISLVRQIIDFIEKHVYDRIDRLSSYETEIAEQLTATNNYLSKAKENVFKIYGAILDILYHKLLAIEEKLRRAREKVANAVLPSTNNILELIDKIRAWLKIRIA